MTILRTELVEQRDTQRLSERRFENLCFRFAYIFKKKPPLTVCRRRDLFDFL